MPNKGKAFGRAERTICPKCGREVAVAKTTKTLRPHNDIQPRPGVSQVSGRCPGSGSKVD